jgi:hypothetical protein
MVRPCLSSAVNLPSLGIPAESRAREAAGQTSYVPHDEALRRLGLTE